MSVIRVTDYETENNPYYGGVAAPYCPENYIVEAGWQDFEWDGTPRTEVLSQRFGSRAEAEGSRWFNLDGVDILVAHNAMYELSWWLERYRDEFLRFYNRGGRVLCTQLAEYLLTHQQELYPSLDETAPKYGGTHKVDGIKILWEQGHLTSQIDPALLHEYLAGPEGDVANTARVFFGQRKALQRAGMWNMFLTRCDALVAYSMCEQAGLYVNQEVAERNLAEHQAELASIEAEVAKLLPTDMPQELEFSWSSLYHKSALLYGGPVKYKKLVPYDPPQFVKADFYRVGEARVPVTDTPAPEGAEVYKAGKNKGQPKVFREDTDEPKLKWGEGVYTFPGLIDIRRLPEALREKFANPERGRKGEWVTALRLCDGVTPVYGTTDEVYSTLAHHGLAEADALSRRGVLAKDISTYYRQTVYNKDGSVREVKGMLQFVNEHSIIHHGLNATATVTTRLSSTRPNLQNIPRGDKDGEGRQKSKVKEMFTSRFGAEGSIVEVDYSALEVVMLAALSRDAALLQNLVDGTDMHCLRLATKLGEPYTEVYLKCHDKAHPEHAKYKQLRTEIKPVAFAAQYGASAHGLAFATGVSVEFAEAFLAAEAKLFPQAIAFRGVVLGEVERTATRAVHREEVDGAWRVYRRGYWQAPGGTCYSFREMPTWSKEARAEVMQFKPTQIANYWNQGEAGFLMAVSMGRIGRWLAKKEFYSNAVFPQGRALLINNVHDAVYLDCHNSVVQEVAETVKRIMENAPIYMSKHLGYSIQDVPFPAEAEYGPSMAEKSKL